LSRAAEKQKGGSGWRVGISTGNPAGVLKKVVPSYEFMDERGAIESSIECESFWMAYDSPDKFSSWPRIELCGQSVPVAPDALERLKGITLDAQLHDVVGSGEKETLKLLVAA